MKRVYIPNNGGHNYTDAERFGQVVFCTEGTVNKWDIAQMFRQMEDALIDARPDDYILLSSLTSLCCVATAVMANKFGEVHFLLFKDGQYVERDLMLENMPID